MVTGKEDLLQALIEAYLMEKGTKDFYAQAAQRALAREAKDTFEALSGWEAKHMGFLQFLYQSIQEDKDFQGFEDFESRSYSPVTEGGIPVKELEARLEQYGFSDDLGAIDMALEIEGKAYNLYQKLSKGAVDDNAKVVFQEMTEQESRHISYLKKVRATLSATP